MTGHSLINHHNASGGLNGHGFHRAPAVDLLRVLNENEKHHLSASPEVEPFMKRFSPRTSSGQPGNDALNSSTARGVANDGSSWPSWPRPVWQSSSSWALCREGGIVAASVPSAATRTLRNALGIPTPRAEIDEAWRRFRLQGIADSRRALPEIYENATPDVQRLMRYAGLDPEHGLLRWGNYDRTLLLPSTVFEADDKGRSYRLRPCVDSIWLRQISPRSGVLMFFLVPDGPELTEAIRGTGAIPVETSRQSTNSWGLRGPEPDLNAPLRGIVLGDSFMQGMFIGDDETPPECLRRDLEERLKYQGLDPQYWPSGLLA